MRRHSPCGPCGGCALRASARSRRWEYSEFVPEGPDRATWVLSAADSDCVCCGDQGTAWLCPARYLSPSESLAGGGREQSDPRLMGCGNKCGREAEDTDAVPEVAMPAASSATG